MTILKGSKAYALKLNSISTENGSETFSLQNAKDFTKVSQFQKAEL